MPDDDKRVSDDATVPCTGATAALPQTIAACQQLVLDLQARQTALEAQHAALLQAHIRLQQRLTPGDSLAPADDWHNREHQLQERVKELRCLFDIALLLNRRDLTQDALAQAFVERIVVAYQFPEVTCARLTVFGQVYVTSNFAESAWQQHSDVVVNDKPMGCLSVGYLAERPAADEGPFLREERDLIDQCSRQFGKATEGRILQETLTNREGLLRSIFEATPDTILTVDHEARIQYINREPSGVSIEAALGKVATDYVAPANRETVNAAIRHVFTTGLPPDHEIEVRSPHELGAWYAVRLAPIWQDGVVGQVLLISENITHRKQAEDQLAYLAAVLTNIPDAVISTDSTLRIRSWNPQAEKMYGWSIDEVIGRHLDEVCQSRFFATKPAATPAELIDLGIWRGEIEQQRKDGQTLYVQGNSSVLYDVHGAPTGCVVVNSDITERKQAERALAASNARFHALFATMLPGVVYQDAEGHITLANPAAEQILGLSLAEMEGLTSCDPRWRAVREDGSPLSGAEHPAMIALHTGAIVADRVMGIYHLPQDEMRWIQITAVPEFPPGETKPFRVFTIFEDITDRRRAAQALSESDARYRQAIRAAGAIPYSLDYATNRYTFIAPEAEQLTGYALAELTPDLIASLFTVSTPTGQYAGLTIQEAVVRARHGGNDDLLWRSDHCLRSRTGVERWISDSSIQVLDEHGQPKGAIGILQDITDRHQVVETLAASERHFRALIENSSDGIALIDANRCLIYASQSAAHILGVAHEEFMADNALIVHPDDIATIEMSWLATMAAPALPIHQVYRFRHRAGDWRWIEATTTNLLADPNVHAIVVNFRDITERKLAEIELVASNSRFQSLFENMTLGVVYQEAGGQLTLANPAAERILGLSLDEIQGRSSIDPRWRSVREDGSEFPGAEHPAMIALRTGRIVTDVLMGVYHPEQDAERWIRIAAVPEFRPGETQPFRVFATFDDITERKQAEATLRASEERYRQLAAELEQRVLERTAELRSANIALEKAVRMKDEFLASMSHELRTPLTGILGLSEALQMQTYGALNERQLRGLDTIWQSGQHLLALINDILDISKLEAAQFELQIEDCNVGDICRASLALVRGMAHKKQQQVDFMMDPIFIDLCADPRRLKQMLVNLLSNAVKFTPAQGEIGLRVQGDMARQVVEFSVWDKGIGITQADLPRLFQPFTQLDSRLAREYSGSGLGLALVQRMAHLHDGTIEVVSTPGEGSIFTLTLPWRQLQAAYVATIPSTSALGDGSSRTDAALVPAISQPLILLAEDNAVSAEVLAEYLAAQGFVVEVASDGLETVRKAVALTPALILMDIRMPLLDGYQAIAQIRAHADHAVATVPIIALTAQAMHGDAERCLAAGANDYVAKPFRFTEILSVIQTQLRQRVQAP